MTMIIRWPSAHSAAGPASRPARQMISFLFKKAHVPFPSRRGADRLVSFYYKSTAMETVPPRFSSFYKNFIPFFIVTKGRV